MRDELWLKPSVSTHRALLITHYLRFVFNRFPALFEHFPVPDKSGARIGRQFEILRQFQTISRTCFLAERTEHASRSVENEFVEDFLAARLAGDDDLDVQRNHVDP